MLVVLLDDRLFVLLILLANEFLGSEEVDDIVIVGLLHRLVDLAMGEVLVSGDIDLADLGLDFLIHADEDLDVARMIHIILLNHMHFGVVETFLREVFLDHRLSVVLEVRRHLRALADTGFDFDILALTFLESLVAHLADTRALGELDDEPYLGALNLLRLDLDIGEETLFPEAFDGLGDLVSRHFNLISHSQTGETDEHEVFVAIGAFHLDTGYLVCLTRHAVLNLGHIGDRHRVVLRPHTQAEYQQ